MKIELYMLIFVFFLKRAALLYAPVGIVPPFGNVALYDGPINVQFEKTVVVNGVALSPAALLSDSNPSEVETDGASAILGSLTAKQN